MRKIFSVTALCGLAALALLCFAACSFAAAPPEFSADMVTSAAGRTMSGKVYASGEKIRTEVSGTTIITRLDQNVSWIIMPSENAYMEQPIDRSKLIQTSKEFAGETERVSMGKEEVEGQPAEKFKVTHTQAGSAVVSYQWVLDSNGFPVKMEAENGSWSVLYKNISFGPQPDDLFEVPAGYQKMAMPSMPAGMPSMEEMMKKMGGK